MPRILFIEDEDFVNSGVVTSLESGHQVKLLRTAAEALAELRQNHTSYDLVILDLMLPPGIPTDPADAVPLLPKEKVGEFVLQKIAELWPEKPTIVLTAFRSNMEGMTKPRKAELLTKPAKMAEILGTVEKLLSDDAPPKRVKTS